MWCKHDKVKVHNTYDFHLLKIEIEHLIEEGNLRRYVQGVSYSYGERPHHSGHDRPISPQPRRGKELEEKNKGEPT